MNKLITVTRKGQATIPASIRRKLGLDHHGGALAAHFDEAQQALIITKPLDIDALTQKLSGYIKPTTTPLTDVDSYYQAHRDKSEQ